MPARGDQETHAPGKLDVTDIAAEAVFATVVRCGCGGCKAHGSIRNRYRDLKRFLHENQQRGIQNATWPENTAKGARYGP
jgi:hypothetical protein